MLYPSHIPTSGGEKSDSPTSTPVAGGLAEVLGTIVRIVRQLFEKQELTPGQLKAKKLRADTQKLMEQLFRKAEEQATSKDTAVSLAEKGFRSLFSIMEKRYPDDIELWSIFSTYLAKDLYDCARTPALLDGHLSIDELMLQSNAGNDFFRELIVSLLKEDSYFFSRLLLLQSLYKTDSDLLGKVLVCLQRHKDESMYYDFQKLKAQIEKELKPGGNSPYR